MKTDSDYMQLALELAASAKGNTNPNPCVGAVLVKDGVIVGTGLHRKAGEPHAEVHAFNMAGEHAKGATLYVTLEPCSHYGKTPPCANLVKESGVSRVVVATMDPNPSVAGRGISLLRAAGIEVEVGLLEQEARKLNERFIHNMVANRPFVISKFAMTMDGKIATHNGHSKWITSEEARLQVHKLRHEMDGILVGVGTVLADNPSLTTRLPHREGENPIRIILDSELKTPLNANVVNTAVAQTIIVTSDEVDEAKVNRLTEKGVQILTVSKTEQGLNLEEMLDELYEIGITDILVEGGAEINGSFLRAGLINKVLVFMAPKLIGGRNSKTPFAGMDIDSIEDGLQLEFDSIEQVGPDLCITAYPAVEIV
ncbi:bifunctional diaminohydroxyphosphoribosylaminopyrimidine deaminase/5-amino-6-(5-phosphoribosylamino)uracil reductase RibD [Ureibacillus chungkukjangi]|uniref:bifunctional diaminohydroxyphosphoribosylaminopyrimidine deaminase/5-amino-6-(5-phosphoribosylamino)uracil reductase RibD n=1 Tax=Ureibacillus chungkukjangi TaxID=1202712 RepID=UPI00203A9669|nr:bifunctional diaminohydroxyphosphoribosylaminopyrimidine deaminase/5-amino-6-(5-phosphoribosylamino)uracil reductase RibD [Ureibacillus chungkukjangi]MCM3389230.1 bifunctional diaminohydroxyphosphoribosylaminopyrimidine deaminase/5-amino-6-(5-phosphoribosylamino)uracil reductase RibD [Ureibacillus chungkukjangi]